MRMKDAKALMAQAAGYRVHFEKRERGMLCGDHFPEGDEPPIADEEDAWKLAAAFAEVDPRTYVNVYVVSALDWVPVDGFDIRKLNTYPPLDELANV